MPAGEAPRRLVPMVAELRMLKEMQSDVNRTTQDLEDLRKASPDGVSDSWGRALDRLLQKQGSVSRLTGELLRDFESFRTPPEGGLGPQEGAEEGGPPDGGP